MMKRLCVAACCFTTLTLGSCADPPEPGALPGKTEPFSGLPLPLGAVLDSPGIPAAREFSDDSEWEGSLRPDEAPAADRVPKIVARGRIIVGIDQSQYKLSYRDSAQGKLRGFEVDLAHEIAADIFGDPSRVDLRFLASGERVNALEEGDVDIVVRTMSITSERGELVDFSVPYLTSNVRLLVSSHNEIDRIEDTAGHTVCVVNGSNVLDLARELSPDSNILRTQSWADCLMALQQFQADAVLAGDVILAGMTAQDPHMEVLDESYATQNYAVGIARGNEGLVRQVNSTMARIRTDGTWDRMRDQWLAGTLSATSAPREKYRPEMEGDQNGG